MQEFTTYSIRPEKPNKIAWIFHNKCFAVANTSCYNIRVNYLLNRGVTHILSKLKNGMDRQTIEAIALFTMFLNHSARALLDVDSI